MPMPRYIGKTLLALPIIYTTGWMGYYIYTDAKRRLVVSDRKRTFDKQLADSFNPTIHNEKRLVVGHLTEEDKELVRKRWASLKIWGRYVNPWPNFREQGIWEWFFWKLFLTPLSTILPPEYPSLEILQQLTEVVQPDFVELSKSTEESHRLNYTWLGQSTSYIQMSGLKILTDPIFSERTLDNPPFLGPKRLRPAPCNLHDLPGIDIVLVSHNHFDHLDIKAVHELGNSVAWYVPLGLKDWFNREGVTNVTELDWWESIKYRHPKSSKEYEITCTPAMHWSGRNGLDTNTTLWGGMHVKEVKRLEDKGEEPLSFFHVGDTGYSAHLFEGIGQVLGPVTLAAIPMGSYGPRWHLSLHHTDPEGSVLISQDVAAQYSFACHWGTWVMSDEPPTLPPQDLEIAKVAMGLGNRPDVMRVIDVGKTVLLDPSSSSSSSS